MICPNCGAPLPDTATLCYSCRRTFSPDIDSSINGNVHDSKSISNPIKNDDLNQIKEDNKGMSKDLKNKVLNYMHDIIDMESRIYIQDELLSRLKTKHNSLNYNEPEISLGAVRKEVPKPSIGGCVAGAFFVLGGLVGLESGVSGNVVLMLALGAAIIFVSIIRPFAKANAETKYIEECNKQKAKYDQQVAEQNKRNNERDNQKNILEYEIHLVDDGLQESKKLLEKMYNINLIYSSYRGLANVCALYDYIASDAAATMKEAYNILIPHIDRGEIITNLKQISSKLDAIYTNQRRTYDIMVESNNKIDKLVKSSDSLFDEVHRLSSDVNSFSSDIENIKKNSELSAYYNKQTAKQLEYSNAMNYYYGEFKNAGVLNQPPSL